MTLFIGALRVVIRHCIAARVPEPSFRTTKACSASTPNRKLLRRTKACPGAVTIFQGLMEKAVAMQSRWAEARPSNTRSHFVMSQQAQHNFPVVNAEPKLSARKQLFEAHRQHGQKAFSGLTTAKSRRTCFSLTCTDIRPSGLMNCPRVA